MSGRAARVGPARAVFVTGAAHSGKTEMVHALGEDPGAVIVRRAYFWRRLYGRFGDLSQPSNLDGLLAGLKVDRSARKLGLDLAGLAGDVAGWHGGHSYGRVLLAAMDHLSVPTAQDTYVIQLAGLEHLAGNLVRDIPDVRIVHLVRDPRLSLGLSDHGRPGRSGWDLARWQESARVAMANRDSFPHNYLILRTEQLLELPEETAHRVADFTGVGIGRPQVGALEGKAHPAPPSLRPLVEKLVTPQLADLGFQPHDAAAGSRGRSWRPGVELAMFHLRSRLRSPGRGGSAR